MKIEHGNGPKKCIRCLRTKKEALQEHLSTLTPCDNPECPFYNDIILAIEEEKNKPKFKIGQPSKPKFKIGPKK